MDAVWAVVVTHNRMEKLRTCLDALAAQERRPDHILVVDNASTDGTSAMLESEHRDVEVLALQRNLGGAGGFHEGMKRAHERGAHWLWLMDDDTIPQSGALAALLSASRTAAGADGRAEPMLLASKVIWRDGSIHPMNFPMLERRRIALVMDGARRGVLPMRAATFVSLLVHRAAIDKHRLPLKHYFLWSDDIEYTSRVVLGGDVALFVPSSVAIHDTPAPDDCMSASPGRFYYHARNTLLIALGQDRPMRDRLLRLWILVSTSISYVGRNRDRESILAIARALRDALRTSARRKLSKRR